MIHRPVLLDEVIEMLNIKEDGIYVDATVGAGGHTRAILSRLSDRGLVIGIDRDEEAIKRVGMTLKDRRLRLIHLDYSDMHRVLDITEAKVDGVLMDLGVSMYQLKDEQRGFSFSSEAPLDMRMDRTVRITAADIVNTWSKEKIEKILRDYADEKRARAIAARIVQRRRKARINTCKELANIVMSVYKRRGRIHPATRTFQALRIAVNNELEQLQEGLRSAIDILNKKGRLCVISYHSVEDRVVKIFFREAEKQGLIKRINKKPITPSEREIKENPSSRSAKLRVGERL
ncbi:MAG: 16S rRNA (cytosine(1402)-N(4))-methyltransferase RsmH [Nitrospirae bacterium]|nr:16S rRNA (cytosine(1402)-N(4))-methyltransferase RsmH [Nitrospirota bacterium]